MHVEPRLLRSKGRFRRRYVVDRRFDMSQHSEVCGTLGLAFGNAPSVKVSMYTVIEEVAL